MRVCKTFCSGRDSDMDVDIIRMGLIHCTEAFIFHEVGLLYKYSTLVEWAHARVDIGYALRDSIRHRAARELMRVAVPPARGGDTPISVAARKTKKGGIRQPAERRDSQYLGTRRCAAQGRCCATLPSLPWQAK